MFTAELVKYNTFHFSILIFIAFLYYNNLKYLHKNRIYYRDLKPRHILLNDKLEPVLTFCSLNQILPEGKKINSYCGTPLFMAPEVLLNRDKVGLPADVYSYSIFLYCLFSLNLKFDTNDNKKLNFGRFMHEIQKGHRFIRPKIFPMFSGI